ncbi:hypothetical protein GW17_00030957 [Ensete ventricosum]|nr:hypothetical protein GW17_00030957 [Ensete ventricosum]RZS24115.1 hypothetical protein BHM03_00057137 [Ensete ventricosum]
MLFRAWCLTTACVDHFNSAFFFSLASHIYLVEEEEAVEAVAADEGKETKVGETRGKGEGELEHHVIGTTIEGAGKKKVRGNGDEDAKENNRDQETIVCLVLDWSMHIRLRQDPKLLSSSSTGRGCVRTTPY